jgi:hypothetical protein
MGDKKGTNAAGKLEIVHKAGIIDRKKLKCRGMGFMSRFAMDIEGVRSMDLNRFYLKRLNDSILLRLLLVIEANRKTTKF